MWYTTESLTYYLPNYNLKREKLIFIDLDGTLITRPDGYNPKYSLNDENNWIYLGPVVEQLNNLWEDGFLIVIVTNQSNYSKNPKILMQIDQIKDDLIEKLGWSPVIFISTQHKRKGVDSDIYRKPNIGMYQHLLYLTNNYMFSENYMCGDAIGDTDTFAPYKWSDADQIFCSNLSDYIPITFVRPIDLFGTNYQLEADNATQNIIILMGNQGSGKSRLGHMLAARGYHLLQRDVIKDVNKMLALAKNILPHKIVLDATHPSEESRQIWIDLANQYALSYCIMWCIRDGRSFNDFREKPVSHFAYSHYTKHFQRPKSQVIEIY